MLALTPTHCAAVYDMLREFPPWKSLKLPPADEIEFHIQARHDVSGEFAYWTHNKQPLLTISSSSVSRFSTLVEIIGHEMIHLYQHYAKTSGSSKHNAEFRKIYNKACNEMGWDSKRTI